MSEPITTVLSLWAGYAIGALVAAKASRYATHDPRWGVDERMPEGKDDTLWDMTKPMKPIEDWKP